MAVVVKNKEISIILKQNNKKFTKDFIYNILNKRIEIVSNIIKRNMLKNI